MNDFADWLIYSDYYWELLFVALVVWIIGVAYAGCIMEDL